ncbi:MAG: T9SS type A sorting domain-containing protein [Flavobacteriales bacterium]|nr:T9SS type A sorting domain-containing protein [Flavobacteriales bacterium]
MRIPFIALVLLPVLGHGQQNLVPNGDFEQYDHCPDLSGVWSINVLHWECCPYPGSPDFYHACAVPLIVPPDTIHINGIPKNSSGYQHANSGDGYMGIFCSHKLYPETREYLQVLLQDSIVAGVRYKVSFYVSLAENQRYAISSLGAYISKVPPPAIFTSGNYGMLIASPQVLNSPLLILTDTINWVLITDTFNSRYGGERYLTIGNFHTDADSDTLLYNTDAPLGHLGSYYYIDDVSVIALDSIPNSVEENVVNSRRFAVYPNPNNGSMIVSYALTEGETGILRVHNTVGLLVMEQSLNASQALMEVDLNGVGSGLYLLSIEVNNDRKLTERISVVR